jgi:hypothetical protein
MSRAIQKERVYHYRGLVERGSRYQWREGYSDDGPTGGITFYWRTKRECRMEAKRDGFKAVFYRDGEKES